MRIICKRSDLIDTSWDLTERNDGLVDVQRVVEAEDGTSPLVLLRGEPVGETVVVNVPSEYHFDLCVEHLQKFGTQYTVA